MKIVQSDIQASRIHRMRIVTLTAGTIFTVISGYLIFVGMSMALGSSQLKELLTWALLCLAIPTALQIWNIFWSCLILYFMRKESYAHKGMVVTS